MINTWKLEKVIGAPKLYTSDIKKYKLIAWEGRNCIGSFFVLRREMIDSGKPNHFFCLNCESDLGYGGRHLTIDCRCGFCGCESVVKAES